MKTISEITKQIDFDIERDFEQPIHFTLKRKNKNILTEKRRILKEQTKFIEMNEYIETLKYLKAIKPIIPKDKNTTKQTELE